MKKAKKVLLLVLCAVLLVGASVAGTVAYLTDSKSVKNTFTVGKVAIELHETGENTRNDGTVGLDLHLIPNVPVDKKPIVTVLKDSEPCYVRAVVTVTVPEWKDADATAAGMDFETWAGSFATNYLVSGSNNGFNTTNWEASTPIVDKNAKTITYMATYKIGANNVVAKNTSDNTTLEAIFDKVCAPAGLTNAQLALLADMTIDVEAHAIQADTFADADAAWEAFGN